MGMLVETPELSCSTRAPHKAMPHFALRSRDGGIRTRDPLNPIQVRYRAALRPGSLSTTTSASHTGCEPKRSEGEQPHSGALPSCATSRIFHYHHVCQQHRV